MIVRTRFAPSPTGTLHFGNIRTALFNWLYARHHKGKFILRIEDTDKERSTQASINTILEIMNWLELNYDEGPFYQSKRTNTYLTMAEHLIDDGFAYRCICSKDRLDKLREMQLANKEKPRYDGFCRNRNLNESLNQEYVIRFKNPIDGYVNFVDQVLGSLSFNNNELDDLVIIRADGSPTYNFCVVVDDLDMKISHVIRGFDHVNNTPRQINIFKAFNAEPPIYGHVPLILDNSGKILSKRNDTSGILSYRDKGFLSDAILNYLVRLGWSHGNQEIFSRNEMIELFDISNVNKSSAAFNLDKLTWLNKHYIKTLDSKFISKQLVDFMSNLKINTDNGPKLEDVIFTLRNRVLNLKDMAEKSLYFYQDLIEFNKDLVKDYLNKDIILLLETIKVNFEVINDWNDNELSNTLKILSDKTKENQIDIVKLIRITVTGSLTTPPINIVLRLIGKEKVMKRIDYMLKQLNTNFVKN